MGCLLYLLSIQWITGFEFDLNNASEFLKDSVPSILLFHCCISSKPGLETRWFHPLENLAGQLRLNRQLVSHWQHSPELSPDPWVGIVEGSHLHWLDPGYVFFCEQKQPCFWELNYFKLVFRGEDEMVHPRESFRCCRGSYTRCHTGPVDRRLTGNMQGAGADARADTK